MHSPYTTNFFDSFFAAQSCAGLLIAALLLFWQSRFWLARGIGLFGVWLSVTANAIAPFAKSMGYELGPDALGYILALSAACGTLTALVGRRYVVAAVGLVGQVVLWLIYRYVTDSDGEQAALHLAWLGLIVGLLLRGEQKLPPSPPADRGEAAPRYGDLALFLVATLISLWVCLGIMRHGEGSADEWAYTYQAAVFAKGHAYAAVPPCQPYVRNFYVFEYHGRMFAQYTPGWPLFIVPFIWLRAPWLSGPVAMGLLAVGVARLTRSASPRLLRSNDETPPNALISSAGTWAAILMMTGVMITINAGSRYPHIYAMALYTWALEAIMMLSRGGLSVRGRRLWGIVLGGAFAMLLATRPAEGATLGVGIAIFFLIVILRRRISWGAFASAACAFAACSLLVLIILRLQLGSWFKTGYSLNAIIYPWNVTKYDMPKPNEWKYGLPLAMAAYCWWPCSLPMGLSGLALLRGRSMDLLVAFGIGCFLFVLYFEWLDTGQRGLGVDWGYGPRYLMMLAVPIAVGSGVAIARLFEAAMRVELSGRRAILVGGPMALVLFALICGWVRIVPLVWPTVVDHTRRHAGLSAAISEMKLKNAIVLAKPGTTGFDALDVTTNFPIDLYPQQDAIIGVEKLPGALACFRAAFPERKVFSASGTDPVQITPY